MQGSSHKGAMFLHVFTVHPPGLIMAPWHIEWPSIPCQALIALRIASGEDAGFGDMQEMSRGAR